MGAGDWQLPKISRQHFLGLRVGFISNALVIGLMTWLGLPVLAAVSADYGLHRLQQGMRKAACIGIALRGLCSRVMLTTTGGRASSGGIRELPSKTRTAGKKHRRF